VSWSIVGRKIDRQQTKWLINLLPIACNMDHRSANLYSSANGAVCCRESIASTPVECSHNTLSSCRRHQTTRRRSHRRHGSKSSSRQFFFALCSIFISACLWEQSQAFSLSSSTYQSRISTTPSSFLSNRPTRQRHSDNTTFYMSAVIEPPSQSSSSRMSDFQRRMKGIVKRNGVSNGRKVVGSSQSASERPANLKVVHTLEEYKEGLDESNGKIVVVRFFATWCKVRMRQVLQTVFSVLYFHSSYCHSTRYTPLSIFSSPGMQSHSTILLSHGSSLPARYIP
jgi:hypothetical protein